MFSNIWVLGYTKIVLYNPKLDENKIQMLKYLSMIDIFIKIYKFLPVLRAWGGHVVAQLVEALRYKSEDRGFDSRCHWNFSLT